MNTELEYTTYAKFGEIRNRENAKYDPGIYQTWLVADGFTVLTPGSTEYDITKTYFLRFRLNKEKTNFDQFFNLQLLEVAEATGKEHPMVGGVAWMEKYQAKDDQLGLGYGLKFRFFGTTLNHKVNRELFDRYEAGEYRVVGRLTEQTKHTEERVRSYYVVEVSDFRPTARSERKTE